MRRSIKPIKLHAMYRTKTLLGVAIALLIGTCLNAQDIYLDASTDGSTVYTNGASFYDSGRLEARYSNFEDLTTTVCSNSGASMLVEFFDFYLEEDQDKLYIFFGEGLEKSPVPGSPFSGDDLNKQVINCSESCLTFRMVTDFNVVRTGWNAEISVMDPIVNIKD